MHCQNFRRPVQKQVDFPGKKAIPEAIEWHLICSFSGMEFYQEKPQKIHVLTHPRFQERSLQKTRVELSHKIASLPVTQDRRDYLLHLLNHAHTPEEVAELSAQVLC